MTVREFDRIPTKLEEDDKRFEKIEKDLAEIGLKLTEIVYQDEFLELVD